MRHAVGEAGFQQVGSQFINIIADEVDHLKLHLVEAVDQDVDFTAVFRKVGSALHPHDHFGGMLFFEQQRSLDLVVIGHADQVHALFHGPVVDIKGICV